MTVVEGTRFDTPYEKGCVASEEPNADGDFAGLDSDGVEVAFHIRMVTAVHGEEGA